MKTKFNFIYNILIIFLLSIFTLLGNAQDREGRVTSIYNQITNATQHQQMLNLRLSAEQISNIYYLCRQADWITETSNAFIVSGSEIYYKGNHGVMHKLASLLGMEISLSFFKYSSTSCYE